MRRPPEGASTSGPAGPVFSYLGQVVPGQFGTILPPDLDWLEASPAEEVLLADLPIVDSHHHLWDHPGYRYLLAEFAADVNSGHHVVGTVYVECGSMYRAGGPVEMRPVGETEFVVGQSAQSRSGVYGSADVASAVVGAADLSLGRAVRPVLEAHMAAGNGRFKGSRLSASWDPSDRVGDAKAGPGLLVRPEVREGMAVLEEMSLVLDCWLFFTQLGELAEAADSCPGLTIVLNHCGHPLAYGPYADNRSEHRAAWLAGIRQLAQRPNIVCKLGGLTTRNDAFDFVHAPMAPTSEQLASAWAPWVEPCVEAFGPGRAMFESNFPVDKMGVGYSTLWNAFERLAMGASDDERNALFSGTAEHVYSLHPLGAPALDTTPPGAAREDSR